MGYADPPPRPYTRLARSAGAGELRGGGDRAQRDRALADLTDSVTPVTGKGAQRSCRARAHAGAAGQVLQSDRRSWSQGRALGVWCRCRSSDSLSSTLHDVAGSENVVSAESILRQKEDSLFEDLTTETDWTSTTVDIPLR